VGGGDLIQDWRDIFSPLSPSPFETTCFSLAEPDGLNPPSWIEGRNCNPWAPDANGALLHSGNNTGLHGLESHLLLHQFFLRPGRLWFRFRVDAEADADGLMFSIDGVRTPIAQGYFDYLASRQLAPAALSFPVPPGWHSFRSPPPPQQPPRRRH
jgi:hypothetical protein